MKTQKTQKAQIAKVEKCTLTDSQILDLANALIQSYGSISKVKSAKKEIETEHNLNASAWSSVIAKVKELQKIALGERVANVQKNVFSYDNILTAIWQDLAKNPDFAQLIEAAKKTGEYTTATEFVLAHYPHVSDNNEILVTQDFVQTFDYEAIPTEIYTFFVAIDPKKLNASKGLAILQQSFANFKNQLLRGFDKDDIFKNNIKPVGTCHAINKIKSNGNGTISKDGKIKDLCSFNFVQALANGEIEPLKEYNFRNER